MFNNKNIFPCRGDTRRQGASFGPHGSHSACSLRSLRGAHSSCGSHGPRCRPSRLHHPEHAPARRAWRTHAFRDSPLIIFGHDLPSACLGQLNG